MGVGTGPGPLLGTAAGVAATAAAGHQLPGAAVAGATADQPAEVAPQGAALHAPSAQGLPS